MATLDPASIELAESMPVDAVPTKLRCGSCNKLAVNAVKLPCCDQSICEPCSQDLPDTCPICGHSPLSSEDCKPNKSLRMTVKAFIKNEEKKRSKEAEANAPKPVEVPTPQAAELATPVPVLSSEPSAPTETPEVPNGEPVASGTSGDDGEVRPTSARSMSQDEPSTLQAAPGEGTAEDEEEDDEDDVVITTERPDHEYEQQVNHTNEEYQDQVGQTQSQEREQTNEKQGFGFDQNQGFGNMDFSNMNNFNPMMAMQNGMGMPGFGMMQNMMGMPGMNMDPLMMFGGGFGGMGGMNNMDMSMMNMGMGMNGMGNFGGMPGMGMNGGSGGGSNFFPPNGGGGGYNQQQNFGSHMNQNFHHNRGYGNRPYNNRGFGRGGRGFYGRGRGGSGGNWQNYGQPNDYHGQNQNFNSHMTPQHQQQQSFRGNDEAVDSTSVQQGATRGSPSYEPMTAPEGVESDQPQRSVDAEGTHDTNDESVNATNETDNVVPDADGDFSTVSASQVPEEKLSKDITNDTGDDAAIVATIPAADEVAGANGSAKPGQTNGERQYEQHSAFAGRGRGGLHGRRGGSRGGGGAYGYVSAPMEPEPIQTTPVAAPINAPSGPKAMRAGLPNSGWYSRPQNTAAATAASPTEREMPVRSKDDSRAHSQSRSASHHGDHKDRSRNKDDERESDEAYERRKERERRRRKERDEADENGDSSGKTRSRSESRDNERSKRRHRDKDDEHRSSRSHRDKSRDRRKHRHRSRSPDREGSANGEYESSRRKSKSDRKRDEDYEESDRARDKSRKHSRRDGGYDQKSKDRSNESTRQGRSSKEEHDRRDKRQSVVEEPEEEFEFKIKGKSASMKQGLDTSMGPPTTFGRERSENRPGAKVSTPVTPSTPVDPYAADRENHRKKREAEQQKRLEGRRQSSQSLGKHSRDDEEIEAPTGPKGDSGRGGKRARKDHRRHSAKYEDDVDGYDERESRRWR